jgi:hypothetical protein
MSRVALAAVVVVLVAAPGASPALSAHNPISATDPAGDAAGGGPDITGVTVSNTTANAIRFAVDTATTGVLPDTHLVAVFINSDLNASTGGLGGFEHTIQTAGTVGQVLLGQWNGTTYVPVTASVLVKTWDGATGTMTFQIPNTALGNTSAFTWWVATEVLPDLEDDFDDVAPDGTAVYSYRLGAPHITAATASYSPAAPRAGRRFRVTGVTLRLSSEETVPATSYRCRATLAGRAMRGTGPGGCTYLLPRNARGKRLVVTTTATLGTESRPVRRTFRVR